MVISIQEEMQNPGDVSVRTEAHPGFTNKSLAAKAGLIGPFAKVGFVRVR
jgi:hypothetical protein